MRGEGAYLGCCCSVFGLAAPSARLAIHASYSGVPRRGGVSAGRPPSACGIRSPTCTLLQDGSDRTARQRNADLIAFAARLISDLCRRIVAPGGRRRAVMRFPVRRHSLASIETAILLGCPIPLIPPSLKVGLASFPRTRGARVCPLRC